MSNVDDFIALRKPAVAMFPVLAPSPAITQNDGPAEYHFGAPSYEVARIPEFNVPPGFDYPSNQETYRTADHEEGHEYDDWLSHHDATKPHHAAFLKFIGVQGDWGALEAEAKTIMALPGRFAEGWNKSPAEWWADTFADARVGSVKVGRSNDALAARAFFLSWLPAAQPKPAPAPAAAPYRTMADSVYPANIPDSFQVVAGYVDGSHAWTDADFAKFEAAGKAVVRICIWNNRYDADVIDVEGGNNNAEGAVPWVAEKWRRGDTPTVYCYSDDGPAGYRVSDVRAACDAAGVKRPFVWITKAGDGSSFDPSGDPEIVALQYEFDGGYDVSVIANNWPVKEAPVNTTGGTGETAHPAPTSATPQNGIMVVGQSAENIDAKVGEPFVLQGIFEWPNGKRRAVARTFVRYAPGREVVLIYPCLDPDDHPDIEVRFTDPAVFVVNVA